MTSDPVLLTFDVDWAPDFAIDVTAALLIERGIRATWMITHRSPAVDRLREYPELFELGIHPNFREGSTHGSTTDAVLRHCMELVPDAVSMRTHSLVQSTPLLARMLATTPIRIDASLLLPRVNGLRPFEQPGMRTFNFHPIHIYLNSRDMTPYRDVRASVAKLDELDEAPARRHVHGGVGAMAMLRELVQTVDARRMKLLKELR